MSATNEAKLNLANALREALDNGLTYEDICSTIAKTLNNYKKEQREEGKE